MLVLRTGMGPRGSLGCGAWRTRWRQVDEFHERIYSLHLHAVACHSGLSLPGVSFSKVVMKGDGSWFAGEVSAFFNKHGHSSPCDSVCRGDRVPFQAVVRLGRCLDGGGGRLGARAGRSLPFGCLDADFPNSPRERRPRGTDHTHSYRREAEPTTPCR